MAQIVEIIGVGPVEFPDGMSKDEMASALKKLPKPTQPAPPTQVAEVAPAQPAPPTQPAPPQAFNVLEASKASLSRQQAEKTAEKAAEIPFEQLYKDPANLKKIQDYATSRFGKTGQPQAGESAEDYVKRWATSMRMVGTGNLISATQELQYLNKASDEEKIKAKEAYDLFDNTASFFSKEGQKGIKPVFDVLGSIISDPTTAISLGAGKIATSAFMKEATKAGVKQAVKTTAGKLAAVPAIEATSAAAADTIQQKIELTGEAARLKQLEEILPTLSPEDQAKYAPSVEAVREKVESGVSGGRVAASAALGAVLGSGETALLIRGGKAVAGKGSVPELSEILNQRSSKVAPPPKVDVPAKDPTEKALEDQYDIFEGRALLDKEGKPTSVAEMQIRNDINKKAAQVAKEVWERVPDLAPQADQKISDAVKNVFMNIDKIDNTVLEDSLAQAGITAEEFARMNRTTVGDAGRTLQAYSVLARLQNTLKKLDKKAAKEVDDMYGDRNALVDSFSWFYEGAQKLDRNLKALLVSQLSTTIRNGYSTGSIVTIGAASEAIESALYRVGKSAAEVATGKPLTGSFTGGLKAVYDDAVRTTFYLGQQGLSSELADTLLSSSPALRQRILRTAGESDADDLWKVSRYANTLNVAQDAFFRKAIFVANVEKQLSRVGLDMYDILAQNKNVPFDVLNNATDEALSATMSKMPTKGPLFYGVKFLESVPIIGSTIAPFPRFMANAMSWSYKHSPVIGFEASIDIARGASMLKKGDDKGAAYLSRGLENASKGIVGTSIIYAAYKYRKENQDTDWFDVPNTDGSRVDIRAFWPIGPFMAMGDWLVKFENNRVDEFKIKELMEAVTGFKAPAGTYAWFGDQFAEAAAKFVNGEGSDSNKLSTFFGEWAGEYLGRALVPAQQLSDIIGAIDRDETLPRDAYQIPKGEEGFGSSFKQQLMKRTPVVKQELPVYQPALREEASFNDSGPLKMLSGVVVKGRPNELEAEVERLNIDFRKVFTSTGDKVIDTAARKAMAPLIIDTFNQVKNTDFYQSKSKDGQKIALQNLLNWAQKTAKKIATNEDIQSAFNQGEQSRIFAVDYGKLPPEVKRETAVLYKETTGLDLNETKDYMSALAIADVVRGSLKFATGGLAGKIVSKATGTAAKKSSLDLLKEMQEAALKKGDVEQATPSPVMDQTANMLMGKKPVLPKASKAAAKPAPAPTEAPIEEALPTPPAQTMEAPTPSKAFADEDYAMGEEAMLEAYTPVQLENMKVFSPEEYANTLHSFTGQAKGLKYSEMPPPPFAKKADESLVDNIEYDINGNEVSVNGIAVTPSKGADSMLDDEFASFEPDIIATPLAKKVDGFESGNLNFKIPELDVDDATIAQQKNYVKQRNDLLDSIRQYRTKEFSNIRKDESFDMFDDEVLGVLQGEFRAKFNREFNVASDKDVGMKMATSYQNKLDTLREQYKDVPDKKLWHGNTPAKIAPVKAKGFTSPQRSPKYHDELMVGAPSFTSDLNLNATADSFGGTNPENILYTKMPYADYVFTRINMQPGAYDTKDLNTIARSINGSSTVVRPISLPRAGYFEKEDMMVEADKLRLSSGGKDMKALTAPSNRDASPEMYNETAKRFNATLKNAVKTKSVADAYTAYGGVRDLMSVINNMASNVSVKGGRGHQSATKLNSFFDKADKLSKIDELNKVADILDAAGAKQKAQALRNFTKTLSDYGSNFGGDAVEEAGRMKELNAVFNAAEKMAKGGLASRR